MLEEGLEAILTLALLLGAVAFVVHLFSDSDTKKGYIDEPPHYMSVVDKTGDYEIYRHDETGIYYFVIDDDAAVVMVNPDGTPYTEKFAD